MSTEIFRGSDTEAFLAELSRRMKPRLPGVAVVNELGADLQAANTSPPRVVWIPSDEQYDEPDYQLEDRTVVALAAETFEVDVWGRTYQEAKDIRRALIASLGAVGSTKPNDTSATSKSGRARRGKWDVDEENKRGAVLTLLVELLWPVTDERIATAHVDTTDASGAVLPPDGSSAQQI